jgi:hypothetical protein
MELVPVAQITVSRLFQNGSGSEQACPSFILLRRRQQRRRKQEKYKMSIWIRKMFQQRQWKSEYYLSLVELKLYDHEYFFKQFRMLPSKCEELLYFQILINSPSNFSQESPLNYPPFCKFYTGTN